MEDARRDWIQKALADYEGPLIRYAIRLLGDPDRARDAVQDTFLDLCQADMSRVEDHTAAWLYRVCRNRAMDIRRKEKPVEPLEAVKDKPTAADSGPASVAEARQDANHLLALLGELPENQRETLYLRFGAGLSYREISEVTGRTVSHVGVLIHQGVVRLRDLLSTREGERGVR